MGKNIFLRIGATALLIFYFQNCSTKSNPLFLSSNSGTESLSSTLPQNHPATPTIALASQKTLVVNKDYVKSLMLEIFTGSAGPSAGLEDLVEAWVANRGSQFGLGCDTTNSYTGRDCNGDSSASNLPQFVDPNTVRESFHLQLCRQVLASDQAVRNALEKINPPLSVPNREAIITTYNLFYRGEDPNANTVNTLLDFDRALAESNEPPLERWRGLILLVCETAGWQLF